MKSFVLVCAFVSVVYVRCSEETKCSCMSDIVEVDGEEVPRTLCYWDTFVVAKVERKHRISGPPGYDEILDGEMRFDVFMSKKITKSGEESFDVDKKTSLFARIAGCGYIDFELGKTYYVSVYEDEENKLNFNGCSFGRTDDLVTDVQRKVMKGELKCPKRGVHQNM